MKYIIIAVVCLAVGTGGGMLIQWKCNTTPAEPELGEADQPTHGVFEKKTELVISGKKIEPASKIPYGGYIKIRAALNEEKNRLKIHAYDDLKYTDQEYPIKCSPIPTTHRDIFMIKPGLLGGFNHGLKKFDYGFSGALDYLRMWSHLGIGGGADGYYLQVSKDWYVGVHAVFAFSTK